LVNSLFEVLFLLLQNFVSLFQHIDYAQCPVQASSLHLNAPHFDTSLRQAQCIAMYHFVFFVV